MSKSQVSARCPSNLQRRIERYKKENGLDNTSEAARQLMQRGVDDWEASEPTGEVLCRQATVVSGVTLVGSMSMLLLGAPWAMTAAVGFASTTAIFASIWAAIRILSRGGLR